MKVFTLGALAAATLLTACGGGGGSSTPNTVAVIGGGSTGSTTEGATTSVTGALTIADPDPGQAVFKSPASLAGTYGTFTFNTATGGWTYLIDNTKPATVALSSGQVVSDTLTVTSSDGSATQDIKISISGTSSGGAGGGATGGIALVASVPAPVYASTDPFAADKVAVFNRLNDDRARCGFGKVAQNALLDKAAQAHADYLKVNDLNTHDEISTLQGFTGATPGIRQYYQGYLGSSGGEVVSTQLYGSYFSNSYIPYAQVGGLATINVTILYSSVYHLVGMMGHSTEVGYGVSLAQVSPTAWQKRLVGELATSVSIGAAGQQIPSGTLASFPCDGSTKLNPIFASESPDPFPTVNRDVTPYGQPVYLMASEGTTLVLSGGTITLRGGAGVPTTTLTKDSDPQKRLTTNQVFLVPTQRLADNSTYDVVLTGTNSGMVSATNPTGAFDRRFSFSTGTFTSE